MRSAVRRTGVPLSTEPSNSKLTPRSAASCFSARPASATGPLLVVHTCLPDSRAQRTWERAGSPSVGLVNVASTTMSAGTSRITHSLRGSALPPTRSAKLSSPGSAASSGARSMPSVSTREPARRSVIATTRRAKPSSLARRSPLWDMSSASARLTPPKPMRARSYRPMRSLLHSPPPSRCGCSEPRFSACHLFHVTTATMHADLLCPMSNRPPHRRQPHRGPQGEAGPWRGSRPTASAGTAARRSHGTAAGRPRSSREPVAELPMRTIRPDTEDNAPV